MSAAPTVSRAEDTARRWLEVDPDPETRAETERLLAAGGDELYDRFGGRLEFGTAGIRGRRGAGPMRMNRVLVRSVAAALAEPATSADTTSCREAPKCVRRTRWAACVGVHGPEYGVRSATRAACRCEAGRAGLVGRVRKARRCIAVGSGGSTACPCLR